MGEFNAHMKFRRDATGGEHQKLSMLLFATHLLIGGNFSVFCQNCQILETSHSLSCCWVSSVFSTILKS